MKKALTSRKSVIKQSVPSTPGTPRQKGRNSFPIVGIGASAGGLEALEQFLRHVPENNGMAFVIIQHLDPDYIGVMPELLQRITRMKVLQVKDRMRVKQDCVYVIPPNTDMSILHGVLHLFEPTERRGLRLPIDFFLRSLAEDSKERSIGVILSGMGSDGTMGLRAIKEKAGLTVVQEPSSAGFDSMPKSAINNGLADIVAPAEELPGKILDFLRPVLVINKTDLPLEEKDQSALEKILILLRDKTGQEFSLYKKNTVYRRIERRMGIHQISRIAEYVSFLQGNPQEIELLFKELLIGVTNFFRDPKTWDQLQREVIPMLLADRPAGGMLRAWSVGCSTGEEAYSLAIAFKEALLQVKPQKDYTLQIFATDLDKDAIEKGRRGRYPVNIAADIKPELLQRYFTKEENGYVLTKEIRSMITFATQNVIMDPPFSKLDFIVCRNLLIYLTSEIQKKLMPLFHYCLNPAGVMLLGSSEGINSFDNLFTVLGVKTRLFRRREVVLPTALITFPTSFNSSLAENHQILKELPIVKPTANLQTLADKMLFQRFSPPAVLVSITGDIIYISGRTGKYLEPPAGKANFNIFAMAREGLRFQLNSAFQKSLLQKEAITVKGLKVGTNGGTQIVDILVQKIEEPEALRGMVMIVFTDVPAQPKRRSRSASSTSPADNDKILELEHELQSSREGLQTTREEMQSSHEELTSTNEELQSTNEELQSTNEELTTSREEMQSLNEELQTVNAEQQSKMDQFTWINNDMRNLLNSTEIVTIFLDNQLRIRRFTTGADELFQLIPGDVGRPITDITCNLVYPEMAEVAREVLQTLVFSVKQIATTDGRWFSVRIMPYRTLEDVIAGVVITFSNITETKALEAELHEENARLKRLLEADK